MTMKTPVMDRHINPAPNGPLRPHPRRSILALRQRDTKKAVRRFRKQLFTDLYQEAVYASIRADVDLTTIEASIRADVDLTTFTVVELRENAKAQGIKGYSKMNKAALIEALS